MQGGNVGATGSQQSPSTRRAGRRRLAITAIADDTGTSLERLHHQRHHADGVGHATARWLPARRCRSERRRRQLDRCYADRTQPGAMTTPPRTPTAASPIRRGWSIGAGNVGADRQPGHHHRHGAPASDGVAITAIATTPALLGDFITSDTSLTVSGTQRRAGCRRDGAGQQRRRRQLERCYADRHHAWSYDDRPTPPR